MGAPPSHKYRKPSPLRAERVCLCGDCLACEIRVMRERKATDDDEVVVSGVTMTRRRARELGVLVAERSAC